MSNICSNWLLSFTTSQVKYTNLLTNGKNEGQFRCAIWDPFLIISQIISLQCIHYASLSFWLSTVCLLFGTSRSLDLIFKYQEIHIRDYQGRLMICAFLMNAIIGAIAIWFLVQRMKLCLDFSSTTYFFHLLICWFYNGHFPTTFSWWFLNVVCLTLTCVYAEFLCMKTELKTIPLKMSRKIDL